MRVNNPTNILHTISHVIFFVMLNVNSYLTYRKFNYHLLYQPHTLRLVAHAILRFKNSAMAFNHFDSGDVAVNKSITLEG